MSRALFAFQGLHRQSKGAPQSRLGRATELLPVRWTGGYSFVPAEVAHFKNDPVGRMRTLAKEPGRENVEAVSAGLVAMPEATQPADVLWLHLFYHDLHAANDDHCLAEIGLRMPWRMSQRNEHLLATLIPLTHIILDDRVAAGEPTFVTKPVEHPA